MIPIYEPRDIIKPIFDFIKSCPFLDTYHIDMTPSGVQRLVTDKPDGSALDYVGSTKLSNNKDLLQNMYTARQANFQLWLLRKSNYSVYRQEIADFLWNFEQWVEYCQAYGLCPKISLDNNDKLVEYMSADNGVFFAEWEGQESSLYVVQLHIIYYNKYKEEN